MQSIELFLSPDEEGGQTLTHGLTPEALAEVEAKADDLTGKEDFVAENSSRHAGGDPNSVADQGWAVVVPDTDLGKRLLSVVQPLIDKRSEDMEGDPVEVFRVPPKLNPAQSMDWQDRTFRGNKLEEDIPAYLTILGDFDGVSVATQRVLSTYSHVGRLGFDRDQDYESYVAKLLRWEAGEQKGQGRALFFTARDGTEATALAERLLMAPTVADARALKGQRTFPASDVIDIAAGGHYDPVRAGDLLLDIAGEIPPSVLFSCSHGLGAPRRGWRNHELQRSRQGILCLGGGEYITAEDLCAEPFLPGGMWIYFACFGAGTPVESDYAHWLASLKQSQHFAGSLEALMTSLPRDGAPFIAPLPKAALANPGGPLGVIGHIDLAWSYSFQDLDKEEAAERHRRFQPLLSQLVRGSCAGLALTSFLATRAQITAEVAIAEDIAARARAMGEGIGDDGAGHDEAAAVLKQVRLGHRWMLHQDLDGYVLLGDPAARMALDPKAGAKVGPGAGAKSEQRRRREQGHQVAVAAQIAGAGSAGERAQVSGESVDEAVEENIDEVADETLTERSGDMVAWLRNAAYEMLADMLEDTAAIEVKSYVEDLDVRLLAHTRCGLRGVEQVWDVAAADRVRGDRGDRGDHEARDPAEEERDRELRALHVQLVKHAQDSRNELLRILLSTLQGRDIK